MILWKIGVLSCGIVSGCMHAIVGLIFGVYLLFYFAGATANPNGWGGGWVFGIAALVALPLVYGLFGLIGGVLTAALYNVVARNVGGIRLEIGRTIGDYDD